MTKNTSVNVVSASLASDVVDSIQTSISTSDFSAISFAIGSGLTLNAIIIAFETFAKVTSDSVTAPAAACITFTFTSSFVISTSDLLPSSYVTSNIPPVKSISSPLIYFNFAGSDLICIPIILVWIASMLERR